MRKKMNENFKQIELRGQKLKVKWSPIILK